MRNQRKNSVVDARQKRETKLEKLDQFISDRFNKDVTWIVLCGQSEKLALGSRLAADTYGSLIFIYSIDEASALQNKAFLTIRKSSAKSWLFNLVIGSTILNELKLDWKNLSFALKNLGFCRFINLLHYNDEFLSNTYDSLNVYFTKVIKRS